MKPERVIIPYTRGVIIWQGSEFGTTLVMPLMLSRTLIPFLLLLFFFFKHFGPWQADFETKRGLK